VKPFCKVLLSSSLSLVELHQKPVEKLFGKAYQKGPRLVQFMVSGYLLQHAIGQTPLLCSGETTNSAPRSRFR
jgi:hypothetical protein